MSLDARVVVTRGDFTLDVDLTIGDEIVAVVGPNGAGKTTLLHAVAGLALLDAGLITLDGVVLDEPATRTWVPPERRRVGVVFQDGLLFPHLSVRENVAFGPRSAGAGRTAARAQADHWLTRLGLTDLADRRPGDLSGGQAQLVALARTLATEPRALLLDEPLSALDATTRPAVRRTLREALAATPGPRVVVTHDPVEAMTLADRIVVLEGGRVVQDGDARALREQPRSRYVADLVGVNLVEGDATHGVVQTATGTLVAADAPDGRVLAVVHPRAVTLHRQRPEGSARNAWPVTVSTVDDEGDRVRVALAGAMPLVAEVTSAASADLGLRPGLEVWASVKATEVRASRA